MKSKILLLTSLLLSFYGNLLAKSNAQLMNEIALGAIIITAIFIMLACYFLLRTIKVMAAILLPPNETSEQISTQIEASFTKPKLTLWEKLLSLRPLSEEKNLLIDHQYDGISELDNPTPAWFMWLFYITIIFASTYLLNFHVFKLGKLQEQEYVAEINQAAADQKVFLSKAANRVDENSVKLSTEPATLNAGAAIFKQNCVPCHGQFAQGIVGPNLTDEYWLHGGKINDVFKTIKYGVPDKGMISWEKQLSPKQISDVANYIKSLKDSHPANAKASQGIKES